MEAIQTLELTKTYKSLTAVNALNLSVHGGELFSLLGVNGAGKTTAIRMLSCLTRPTAGDALVMGKSIVREPALVKRVIGVSPQETAVAQNLTVKENLEFMCGVHGLSREETKKRVENLTDRFSLGEALSRRAGKLSGGWQRRLSIAMALVSNPEILFLDEPTLGLDVIARAGLWDEVRSFKGKMTVILTTHSMEEAGALSDRVGVMHRGKLIAVGTPSEICEKTGAEKFEDAFVSVVKEAENR